MNGLSTHYYKGGQKEYEGSYSDCRETGTWTYYHPNGMKMKEGNFKLGFEDGVWQFWDENGKLTKAVAYREGEVIDERIVK